MTANPTIRAGGARGRGWGEAGLSIVVPLFNEAVGLATMALAQSFEVAVVGALAMGAAFSLLYPSLSLIVVARVPETRRGAALGTFTAFFDAGIGLGAPLAGGAAVLAGYEGAFLFSSAAALIAMTTIALTISTRGRALLANAR